MILKGYRNFGYLQKVKLIYLCNTLNIYTPKEKIFKLVSATTKEKSTPTSSK
jgi:hypothetical protein